MNDVLLVGGLERIGDLPRDRQDVGKFQSAWGPLGKELGQRGAVDELHHERRHTVGFLEPVDLRDVRMVQRREHVGFALKSHDPLSVARERFGKDFQRNIALQLRVARPVDLPHPAGADQGKNFVRADTNAGCEGIGSGWILGGRRRSTQGSLLASHETRSAWSSSSGARAAARHAASPRCSPR